MLHLLDGVSPCALFFEAELSAIPSVRLLCRLSCCCNRKLNGCFFSPFHSVVLIRKVGVSLSNYFG